MVAEKDKKQVTKEAEAGKTVAPPAVRIQVSPKVAAAKGVVDAVHAQAMNFIKSGELIIPKDYDINGALKSAWLVLQEVQDKSGRPALEVCTQSSIANALLGMIIQSLHPIKKQCAFVVFGTSLVLLREYFGSMAIAERLNPEIADWGYQVVYEDDDIDYDIFNGRWTEIRHKQKPQNIANDKIIGAYAMPLKKVPDADGKFDDKHFDLKPIAIEYMTIEQLHEAWKMSPSKPFDEKGKLKESSAHAKFTADFARKTVINKVSKFIINRSSDNKLLLDQINRTADLLDASIVQEDIKEVANTGPTLSIEGTGTPDKSEPGQSADPESKATLDAEPGPLPFCPDGGEASVEKCQKCESGQTCSASQVRGTVEKVTAKGNKMPGF